MTEWGEIVHVMAATALARHAGLNWKHYLAILEACLAS